MPADPYTLGIGVEIDERATEDALDRLTKTLETGVKSAADSLGTASKGLGSLFVENLTEVEPAVASWGSQLQNLFQAIAIEVETEAAAISTAFGDFKAAADTTGSALSAMFETIKAGGSGSISSIGALADAVQNLTTKSVELGKVLLTGVPSAQDFVASGTTEDELVALDEWTRRLDTARAISKEAHAAVLEEWMAAQSEMSDALTEPLADFRSLPEEDDLPMLPGEIGKTDFPGLPEAELPMLPGEIDLPVLDWPPIEPPILPELEPIDLPILDWPPIEPPTLPDLGPIEPPALPEIELPTLPDLGPIEEDLEAMLDKTYRDAMKAGQAISYLGSMLIGLAKTQYEWLKPAEELEALTQKIAVSMGGGRVEARALRGEILSLSNATGFSTEEVGKLEQGLSLTGHTLGSFSSDTQKALVSLSTQFGVSGEQSAQMAASISYLGGDINQLLGDTTEFTEDFGMPGAFAELPGLIESARTATLTYSSSVVGTGDEIVKSTMEMAGGFARAFGTTFTDGLKRAQAAMEKMRGAAQQDADVFLGLSDGFSELSLSVMATGAGFHKSLQITRDASRGSLSALGELAAIKDQMPTEIMKERFMRQLQKELPADLLALVEDVDKLHEAMALEEAAARFDETLGVRSFNALGDTMRETTMGFRSFYENSVQTVKAILGASGVTDVFRDVLESLSHTFKGFASRLLAWTTSEEFTETMERWKPIITSVGKAVVTFGAIVGPIVMGIGGAITSAAGALFGFRSTLAGLGASTKTLATFDGLIGKLGKGIFKVFGKLGPIGLIVGAVSGIKTAVEDMAAVLGNPNATGAEKFGAMFRGVFKGVAEFANTMLLGIPGMIVDWFFPEMESEFDAGFSSIWRSITSTIGGFDLLGALSASLSTVGDWLSNLSGWLDSTVSPALEGFAESMGEKVGQVFVGLGELAIEGLWDAFKLFSGITLGTWLYEQLFTAGGKGVGGLWDSFTKYLGGIGDLVFSWGKMLVKQTLAGLRGLAKGVLGAFGISFDAVETRVSAVFETISYMASRVWKIISPVARALGTVFNTLWETTKTVFGAIFDVLTTPMWATYQVAKRVFSAIGDVVSGLLDWLTPKFDSAMEWLSSTFGDVFSGAGYAVGGLINDFDSFLDAVETGFVNFMEPISVSFTTIVGYGKLAWAALSDAWNGNWSSMKLIGLQVLQSITNGFLDLAETAISSLEKPLRFLASLPGGKFLPGLDTALSGLSSIKGGLDGLRKKNEEFFGDQIAAAEEASKASSDRANQIKADTAREIEEIHERAAAERNSIESNAELRRIANADEEADYVERMSALERQADEEQSSYEARQQHAMDSIRWRDESRSQLEKTLQALGEQATETRSSGLQAREASAFLRDFMAEQVDTISAEVARGALTAEEASARLEAAAKTGLDQAGKKLSERTPGDVADSARGAPPQTSGGLSNEAIQQLMQNMQKSVERDRKRQKVDVTFRGDGPVVRSLAQSAHTSRLSTTGGGT